MIKFLTSAKATAAACIFDQAVIALGAAKASNWMFTGNADLGGRSPIEAIRQGDDKLVLACIERMAA